MNYNEHSMYQVLEGYQVQGSEVGMECLHFLKKESERLLA